MSSDRLLIRETAQVRSRVVVSVVLDTMTTPKHLDQEFKRRLGKHCLGNRGLMLDLPAEKATEDYALLLSINTLTVNEADGPLLNTWSFLLIVRTARVVTGHAPPSPGWTRPSTARIHGVSSI